MDGIVGIIKIWYLEKSDTLELSESTAINTPENFTGFANSISTISCLYLTNGSLQEEPDHLSEYTPIPDTIRMH